MISNFFNLKDKLFLVTGASSEGIGRATAILLSQLGARVILVGRNKEQLDHTFAKLLGSGHGVEIFDLTQVDEIPDWMKTIADNYGSLNGLVHSAGLHLLKPLALMNADHLRTLMDINVFAAMSLVKGIRQKMVRATSVSVVLLSSVVALVGQPVVSGYAASKGALLAMMRSLALELAPENVRVNCISPGIVETDMTTHLFSRLGEDYARRIIEEHPLGIGQPQDVANAIVFLLSEASRWITGTNMVLDGGYTAK